MKKLSTILTHLKSQEITLDTNIDVVDLSLDSRTIKSGTLFCAIKGEKNDGHDFIEMAIQKGACAIFCEKLPSFSSPIPIIVFPRLATLLGKLADFFYDSPSKKLKIIGLTGTNGKTSTSHYIAQYLHLLGKKVALIGTVGNGLWGHLSSATHTTPDLFSLYKALYEYEKSGVEYVSMEVSSHALAQNRTAKVQFYAAVFTNLSRDHLDYHLNMQNYCAVKARLFKKTGLKYAIINADDAYSHEMIKSLNPRIRCFLYSQIQHDTPTDHLIFSGQIEHMEESTKFQIYTPWGRFPVLTRLLGEFNIANLNASITTLSALGFDTEMLARLTIFIQPVIGRMETLRHRKLPLVVIDFAHSPDALEKALQSLQLYNKSIWLIFGCGGNRDRGKRAEMAKIAEFYADHVIVTEDNSRLESITDIFSDIRLGFHCSKDILFIENRSDAIHYALKHADKNAIVLLAGKGHEKYLDKNGEKIRYDEREVVMRFAFSA